MSKNIFIVAGCVAVFALFVFGLIQLTVDRSSSNSEQSNNEVESQDTTSNSSEDEDRNESEVKGKSDVADSTAENEDDDSSFQQLVPKDFSQTAKQSDVTLIDVRTKEEFDAGHISGAENIDFYAEKFADNLNKLDKDKKYAIYCRSGNRTGQTMELMKQLGFKNVSELKNGIVAWQGDNMSLCSSDSC